MDDFVQALLKSPQLSSIAPLIVILCLWLGREALGIWKHHRDFKRKIAAEKDDELRATVKGLSSNLHENTIAVVQLTERISSMKEALTLIPELSRDVNKLGDKARRMDEQLKSLLNKPSTT